MKRRILVLSLILFFTYIFSLLVLPPPSSDGRIYLFSTRLTYTNRGALPKTIEPGLNVFNVFVNTSWQTAYIVTSSGPYTLTKDADRNTVMVFDSYSIPPGENVTISYKMQIVEKMRKTPDVSMVGAGSLSDIPQTIRESYTGNEGCWIINEELKSLANDIWASQDKTTNALKLTSSLADWIGKNVKSTSQDVPLYPNETYANREGDCDDQANLLIALCRTLGIPAYLQIGALKASSTMASFWESHVQSDLRGISYHGWAMVYIPPWGWLPFDMTLGWKSGDSLSVVKSAKAWSLDAATVLNVTESDWAGEGQAEKGTIVASSTYISYEETLTDTTQKGLFGAVADWGFQIATVAVLSITIIALATYLRKRP